MNYEVIELTDDTSLVVRADSIKKPTLMELTLDQIIAIGETNGMQALCKILN